MTDITLSFVRNFGSKNEIDFIAKAQQKYFRSFERAFQIIDKAFYKFPYAACFLRYYG